MSKKATIGTAALLAMFFTYPAAAALYAEYYRDNLFLGLAYHRVACVTDWNTIQSNQDYDGFTSKRYCFAGTGAASVPDATWFDYRSIGNVYELDTCGARTNTEYGTPNYASRSNTCSYNVFFDCNSDCWIDEFSRCHSGRAVSTTSPCF